MPKKLGNVAIFIPITALTDEDFDALQAAAKVEFHPEQRKILQDLFTVYAEGRASWEGSPTAVPVIDSFKDVERIATDLNNVLHTLIGGRGSPADEVAGNMLRDRLPPDIELPELRRWLAYLREAAGQAAASIKPERGAPGDPPRDRFIHGLQSLFTAAGGRGRVSNNVGQAKGALVDFVAKAFELAGVTISNGALRNALYK